jgi:hypothetical protein
MMIWKGSDIAYSRYFPSVCRNRMRKTIKSLRTVNVPTNVQVRYPPQHISWVLLKMVVFRAGTAVSKLTGYGLDN